MVQRQKRRRYRQVPKGRIPIKGVVWLTFLGMFLALMTSLGLVKIRSAELVSSLTYKGHLTSNVAPVQIDAPIGVTLEDILVTNGEAVRRGQTLASFDQEKLAQHRADLTDSIQTDQVTLYCLAVERTSDKGLTPSENPSQSEDCLAWKQRINQTQRAHKLHVKKTEQEIALIDAYIAEAHQFLQSSPMDPSQNLDRILALSLTKIALHNSLDIGQLEYENEMLSLYADRERVMADTRSALRKQQAQLNKVDTLVKNPRLHAPFSGTIIKLRRPPPNTEITSPLEVFSLLPQRDAGYAVHFQITEEASSHVQVGDAINVETIGLPALIGGLTARVSSVTLSQDGTLRVAGDLTTDSALKLAESPYARQILANSSAVTARIQKKAAPARTVIVQALANVLNVEKSLVLKPIIDWTHRLASKASPAPPTIWEPQVMLNDSN